MDEDTPRADGTRPPVWEDKAEGDTGEADKWVSPGGRVHEATAYPPSLRARKEAAEWKIESYDTYVE